MKTGSYIAGFLLLAQLLFAQQPAMLTEEEVIRLTVEGNFDIQLARNNEQVAKNTNNLGTAGMLPLVTLNASPSISNNNLRQKFSNGLEIERQNVGSSSMQASVGVTWYFFDGLKMFATKKRLDRAEELSSIQLRQTIESKLLEAFSAYYRMVSIRHLIRSLGVALELAAEQQKLAAARLKAGTGSNVDVLQSQIDYNNIQVQILQQQNLLNEESANLNTLFRRAPETDFSVPDTIIVQTKPDYANALKEVDEKNKSVLAGMKSIGISEQVLREFRGNRLPRLGIFGNYGLNRNQNEAGFALFNQSLGYNLGLTATWTLLNNLATHTAIKNQLVQLSSEKIRLDAIRMQEKATLYKAYFNFTNDLAIIAIEKQSMSLASDNLKIAAERMRLGLSNYIEYRTVEKSYEETVYRLSQALYATKVSELQYLKANGTLMR
jgi:outer membrane protein